MKSTRSIMTLSAVAFAFFTAISLADIPARVSVNDPGRRTDRTMNPRTPAELGSVGSLSLIGVALLNSEATIWQRSMTDEETPTAIESVELRGVERQRPFAAVLIGVAGDAESYPFVLPEELVDRAILLVKNDATGVYTYDDDIDAKLAERNGFVSLSSSPLQSDPMLTLFDEQFLAYNFSDLSTGFVASELSDKPLSSLVGFYLDFVPDEFLDPVHPEFSSRILSRYNGGLNPGDREFDYIVHDADTSYEFVLTASFLGNAVSASGQPYRYGRRSSDDPNRVWFTSVTAIDADADSARGALTRIHEHAMNFCRLVALLRTINRVNEEQWNTFLDAWYEELPNKLGDQGSR